MKMPGLCRVNWFRRALIVPLAIGIDHLLGEPPVRVHPLVVYGKYVNFCEELFWTDTSAGGLRYLIASMTPALLATRLVRKSSAAELVLLSTVIARRSLVEHASRVHTALVSGDLDNARRYLGELVGRDTEHLDEVGICAAVIESVAENYNDAVAASIFWGNFAGSLGSIGHRISNTCDALVGKKSALYFRFGLLPARLDDVLGFLPARIGAGIVALLSDAPVSNFQRSKRDAKAHPSPNAGLMEASFGWNIGVQLGGILTYSGEPSYRPTLGPTNEADAAAIGAAIELLNRSTVVLGALVFVIDLALGVACRRLSSRRP